MEVLLLRPLMRAVSGRKDLTGSRKSDILEHTKPFTLREKNMVHNTITHHSFFLCFWKKEVSYAECNAAFIKLNTLINYI